LEASNVSDANFDILIDIAIKDAELTGMSQRHAQAILQFVFLGLHPGEHLWTFSKNTKLEKFLWFDLFFDSRRINVLFCGIVLQKLSKVINLRDLETDLIQGLGTGDNKLFVSNDFTYKQLYDLYAENGDLSTDFLLFNELFKTSTEKVKLSSYSELTKLTNITNLVRPDLAYSLATNKLNVNFERKAAAKR
jgi:hypothetical protein